VTIEFLRAIANHVSTIDPEITTEGLCEKIVKPWTEKDYSSLTEVMAVRYTVNPHPVIKLNAVQSMGLSANIFVSHAWKNKFLDLVEILEVFHAQAMAEKGLYSEERILYWIDLFVCNQWNHLNFKKEWFSSVLESTIQDIGHTVFILNDFSETIPLTRLWCVFELYCTIQTNTKLSVLLKPDVEEKVGEVCLHSHLLKTCLLQYHENTFI